jgi:hypothetical protein
MIRTKAKLAPFMLSLSKYERDELSIPPFDKLRANGNISLYTYHCFFSPEKILPIGICSSPGLLIAGSGERW